MNQRQKRPQEAGAITLRGLCRALKVRLGVLRGHYMLVNENEHRRPCDEWLCDNYYVLEKEAKQSVKDALRLKRGGETPLLSLYLLFEEALKTRMPPIDAGSIALILARAQKRAELCERQFAFVPVCIKIALINMAYYACTESGSEREMAYAITGIIKLAAIDFDALVDSRSRVEKILRQDPAAVYGDMSAESRRRYRRLIACIARKTGKSESEIAAEKLRQAAAHTQCPKRHIGYWITKDKTVTAPRRHRGVAALALGAALPLVLCAAIWCISGSGLAAVLCFLPLWEILRTPIWQFALAGVDVDFIPRMDLDKLAQKPKTVVLVSTLLPKANEAATLKKRLEQLYYSNSDPDMYYCILADFKEWDYPADEKDDSQVEAAKRIVEELNAGHSGRFMLFLRSRVFNKTQRKYAGWERKRGAITEFIRFLKGESTSVHTFVGEKSVLAEIRYIIALDSDTSLLYECAQNLVAAAVHPLNTPVIGAKGVVTSGYGVLVPRVSPDLATAKATAFSRLMAGCGGVTAYDASDKDFYQDLFAESIFSGKALIDADCFYALLNNRFPENQILSHDILEGAVLRAGFVSDVEMTDSVPSGMTSWLTRLHRWMRGDWQNVPFLFGSINALSKFKILDNLRRAITPVFSLGCCVGAVFFSGRLSLLMAFCGVLSVTLPSLWAAVWSVLTGGFFTLSRRFFTRGLPHALELLGQALVFLVMLPAQAFSALDAFCRSMWRLIVTRKKMLEWATAAAVDARKLTVWAAVRKYALAQAFGLVYLALAAETPLCVLGLIFALITPMAYYTARPSEESESGLSPAGRDALISYNAAMWRYYEDFANAENNWLPPDNIQQSPVFRVAARTSPTNIGMMLLSVLCARDLDFIDTDGLYTRLDRTLTSVEKLKRYAGNLINWYDTTTLETLQPEFVSTVDSGNFICCLVALKEGLAEFLPEKPAFSVLIARIETLINTAELDVFYDKRKKLFSIGYDCGQGKLIDSHYDFLMSEARLTSYFAVARKTVGKKHWGAFNRTMSRFGPYAGAVSWTGTMFEYYMPHLLLPVYDGSLLGEALTYCLYCQKKRAKERQVPWGISESAFYAFDNNLNYQYKAHGVQKLGVKRYLDKELVISPYSTFITIPFNPNSSMRNLHELRELGVYGRYGFFEAVDFTGERVGEGALAVTRSYMAHHIGMSMVASCNALFENRMQKRFMKDNYMRSAEEFLQEKIAKNTVVYDELKAAEGRNVNNERPKPREAQAQIDPQAPRCALLTNGELTDVLTDTGAGFYLFGGDDFTRRSDDLLRRAQGFFVFVRCGGEFIPLTRAPLYEPGVEYTVDLEPRSAAYYAKKGKYELGMKCAMHPTISCEQRQIVVKNGFNTKRHAQILLYLEPVLASFRDYNAHPAYSKLFVTARYDHASKTITFSRRNRDCTRDKFLTIGFAKEEQEFAFETVRENLMSAPNGFEDLRHVRREQFTNGGGVPDSCCGLLLEAELSANGQFETTVLLAAARTEAEGISAVIAMRKTGKLESKNAALSPLSGDSLEGRLVGALLGQLLFTRAACEENAKFKLLNKLGQSGLWPAGISGDLPIVLLELGESFDEAAAVCYIKIHASLRALGVGFDLCVILGSISESDEEKRVMALLQKHGSQSMLGQRGGVFLLRGDTLAEETLNLIRATARHTASGAALPPPQRVFAPIKIASVTPAPMPQGQDCLVVNGGAFKDGAFYCDRKSPLPFCHVLANPVFGTLVSDTALGFTWAINSRENKLTPWYNDICTDNAGELLLIKSKGECHNLIHGSRAVFFRGKAVYSGTTGRIRCETTVTVAKKGFCKCLRIHLINESAGMFEGELAYYIEPVLHVDRTAARHIVCRKKNNALLLYNPYNTACKCYGALRGQKSDGEEVESAFTTDRTAFLCGDWGAGELIPTNDPCAAAILPVRLEAGAAIDVCFTLTYGASEASALFTPGLEPFTGQGADCGEFEIATPDRHLNEYINHFAPMQILSSRLLGRCAFYQCGGAYGFRDQLQDISAYLLIDPALARRHILRCCSAQFEEGDVLHWWHALPKASGGIKGVRTRFSDDLAWLPFVCEEYVQKTGDMSILSVKTRYLQAESLAPGEHEKYITPQRSDLTEDVFCHCLRALEKSYNLGQNGLPLIGCGDWNDGFSSVGLRGRGTSVWLALFLAIVNTKFAAVCRQRGEPALADKLLGRAESLKKAVDRTAWDGNWYLRAFYDNGGRMGSHDSGECRIDLLPQSFAVLAEMPDKNRVQTALNSGLTRLVDDKLRLVRLFEKPFQHGVEQPGYVKAYPAGLRENGGQYTHAAVWFAIALLEAERNDEGWRVLEMLNPANRAANPQLGQAYKLEPYYMAADIYTNPGAAGRGGWSIYTGAASWYYRGVIENLMGLKLCGDYAELAPKLPTHWKNAALKAKIRGGTLRVTYGQAYGREPGVFVDGIPQSRIPLDGCDHTVEVRL